MTKAKTTKTQTARSIEPVEYNVQPGVLTHGDEAAEQAIIEQALAILRRRVNAGPLFTSPQDVRNFLVLEAAKHDGYESFGVMFLDAQHRLIEFREMFRGTLTQTSVYPREIVRAALEINCAAVVLTHNHPSGSTQPSRADEALTHTMKSSLLLVDVRILDHIITAGGESLSMAERGLV